MPVPHLLAMTRLRLLVLLAITGAGSAPAAEIRVISNQDAGITAIAADTLSDYYLGKRKKLPNGHSVVVFTSADRDETERFLDAYLGETPASFSAAWKRMIFTGRGIPPTEAANDQDMVDRVRTTPGAIGYVRADAPSEGVTVLAVAK